MIRKPRINQLKRRNLVSNDEMMKKLSSAVLKIFNKDSCSLSFEELYRFGYNLTIDQWGNKLYYEIKRIFEEHCENDVYKKLKSARDALYLKHLVEYFGEYEIAISMVKDVLLYLDRSHCKPFEMPSVYSMGIGCFKERIVLKDHEKIISFLFECIQSERDGQIVSKDLIRKTSSLLLVNGDEHYINDFENQIVKLSREYYEAKCISLIEQKDMTLYFVKAEEILNFEGEALSSYFIRPLYDKLIKVIRDCLLKENLTAILALEIGGVDHLLKEAECIHLKRIYNLLTGIESGQDDLKKMVLSFVSSKTNEINATCPDFGTWSNQIVQLKRLMKNHIQNSFENDKTYEMGINQAFASAMNSFEKSPEFISLHVDELMRNNGRVGDDEIDQKLDTALSLFRFLSDKDIFERYYKAHLAKRLLLTKNFNVDVEKSMVSRLKVECGYQFTIKLEGMFNDIKVSEDLQLAFDNLVKANTAPLTTFTAQILTMTYWPLQTKFENIKIQSELQSVLERYKAFYLAKHSGRRLTWLFNMGNADLKAYFPSRKHELNVTTFQMLILLLFNEKVEFSVSEIFDRTGIPHEDLLRHLQALSLPKHPVLLKSGDDLYKFNDSFQNSLTRIKIPVISTKSKSEAASSGTRARVVEDRKNEMEAVIVRVMKSRKLLKLSILIVEVTQILSLRFKPNPADIKKRIESLIEREFLERDENDKTILQYLA